MKTKNILLGFFSLLTFVTYARTEKNEKAETKTAVTELKLAFANVNKSESDKSKVRVDNFEMKLTGKTADLDKLTERLKKSFNKLGEIDGRNIKNS